MATTRHFSLSSVRWNGVVEKKGMQVLLPQPLNYIKNVKMEKGLASAVIMQEGNKYKSFLNMLLCGQGSLCDYTNSLKALTLV